MVFFHLGTGVRQLELLSARSTLAGCRSAQEDGGKSLCHPGDIFQWKDEWEGLKTLFEVEAKRRRWQEMGECEAQSGGKTVFQVHQDLFSIVKMTMFNAYQLSTSIKDIG